MAGSSERFQYQREKKQESEDKIVNALGGEERRFTELLKLTGLSKPVLNNHLHRMRKEGKVERIKEKGRRPRYKFTAGTLGHGHVKRVVFSMLSTQLFNDIFEATENATWSNDKFVQRFSEKTGLLALFTLYIGLSIGRKDPEEGGKWIEEGFGTLIQKYAWRRCFFRQILEGEYELKSPVLLREPVTPEFSDDLVKLPEAFVPGVTSEILMRLPEIPEKKLEDFRRSLEKVHPEDVTKLHDMLNLIEIAGR